MKTNIPPKPKQIKIKQEPPSHPPTSPAKLSESEIEDLFNQQMLRETMEHINDDSEEEEEKDASKVGAGFSRLTSEHTPHNDIETDTDQPRRNPVQKWKPPVIYGYKIQYNTTIAEPTNYHQAINSPDSGKW
ncbi:uncharacterized protein H6S33_002882 [Morchella sextelata]|uniref:uncharacterized protein n=1 Tax=Morchella sextelata TaxID=1174677 RepID=UPI001D05B052|nr:uncharacterized protein H6S33_002882 [Morchella sextelata]KAH0607848.1 hypothetical protein H6S33_002882 [Morchella sextelata]